MSEPTTSTSQPEAFEVPADPTSAFGDLLGFLAPETNDATAGAGAGQDGAAGAGAGQQPAAAEGAGAAAPAAPAPAGGDGGQQSAAGAAGAAGAGGGGSAAAGAAAPDTAATGAAGAAGDAGAGAGEPGRAPGAGTGAVDAATLTDKFGEIAAGFETRQTELFQQQALAAVREDYGKYFENIQKHPRLLVGMQVPSTRGDGQMETLRDTQDAREWQEAVKQLLVDEVNSRVAKQQDELRDVFTTVHSSIDLFRNNVDLIPGTKQFDAELANAFAAAAKDYELRSNGKLVGYSVPVQPIINAIRSQLSSARGAAAATPPPPTAQQQKAAEQSRSADGRFDAPQAGIPSRAGQSAAGEEDIAGGVMGAFFRQNGVL